ncbi:decarboxylase [Marinicauda salina]|uniref:ornithine decarboxylase n=1 Tax=Marinicauda salina TaxID=2135793 RepID=A0A2U2BQW2_9PROT|nr:type III PLP-dependent enzyme [Marinicauda salina]PWE16407.1 decarboxylase [Marinicauda salina]
MSQDHTPLDLVRNRPVEGPVACARPDRLKVAADWFLENFPGEVLYAVKANPSSWVVDGLYAAGVRWFDVASTPEIEMIAARCPDAVMAFMHPVKSRKAIRTAYHDHGVRIFALDCEAELAKILEETGHADDLTLIVRLAVSNDGASLPLAGKFGATEFEAPDLIRAARAHAAELGVSFHVGSQCMTPSAYRAAMMECSRLIAKAGVTVDIVDVGGGFPSVYPGLTPPPLRDYIDAIESAFNEMMVLENADLWCEPGRALIAEAASVLARVELVKADAVHLNDGAYGCLFDLVHARWSYPMRVHRASGAPGAELAEFRLYGPTCDSIDSMPGAHLLPADLKEGDVIEFGMLGAYGTAMATRFNGFGDVETVTVSDFPWTSLYDDAAARTPAETGRVVAFRPRRRRHKLIRRRG